MAKRAPAIPELYIFEVSLLGVKPRLWRRFALLTEATFGHLHEAIQDACGWWNSHLFAFQDGKGRTIAELPDDEADEPGPDALTEPIRPYFGLKPGRHCLYVYDFGDHWEHRVEVVAIWPEFDGAARALIDGEGAFPPEDCGGLSGYEECVAVAIGRRRDPERKKWLDGWHPKTVDLKETRRLFYQAELFLRGIYD